jgi:hypothetical protein
VTDDRLRFRVRVDGEIVAEDWLPSREWEGRADSGEQLAQRHKAICEAAEDDGKRWQIEVYDPDVPEAEAYLRFGTDQAGMVLPVHVVWTAEAGQDFYRSGES